MDNIITWIKLAAGVITGLLSYLFGGLDMLFTALLVCIAVDYITGVLAALYEKRLNSEVGFRGILKKVVILLIVVLAHMIENAAGITGIRDIVIGFYIANEGISVLDERRQNERAGMQEFDTVFGAVKKQKRTAIENYLLIF